MLGFIHRPNDIVWKNARNGWAESNPKIWCSFIKKFHRYFLIKLWYKLIRYNKDNKRSILKERNFSSGIHNRYVNDVTIRMNENFVDKEIYLAIKGAHKHQL